MAYPGHALLAICGKWPGASDLAAEQWQFGVRLHGGSNHGGFLEDPDAYLNAIATPLMAWFGLAANKLDGNAQLQLLKCNNITPDGHYKDTVTHQKVVANTPGGAANKAPAFCDIVYTLETGKTTGGARRGRMYPPNAAVAYFGAVSVSATECGQHAAAAKALLTLLSINEPAGDHSLVQPCVVSRSNGALNLITGVSVDTRIDVQRRRKNRATGTRTTLVFP